MSEASILCAACGEETPRDVEVCRSCGADPRLRGRYVLEGVLGRGAAGITYRALDLESDARVAVKEMPCGPGVDATARERIEREARVLRQLDHPGIPRYVDHFTAGAGKHRAFYLVQELIDGPSLEAEMDRRRYREEEVLDLLGELLDILEYLHALRPAVVHRDIKPRNVMRRPDGRLVLVDFGSVRDVIRDPALGGSTIAGTYGYMAPEQFRGDARPATDIYGLAVLAVVLLSRRPPDEMMNVRHELEWRPWVQVAAPVAEMLERWLAVDPDARPADAAAARADLQRTREALRGKPEPPPAAPEPLELPTRPRSSLHDVPRVKNKLIAALLAFVGAPFGIHHWYLGNRVLGLLSVLFCWTTLPVLFNAVHGILLLAMPEDEFDRRYNPVLHAMRAAGGFTDQLADLHRLHRAGALTQEEFEYEKARLLALRDRLLPAPRRRRRRRKRLPG